MLAFCCGGVAVANNHPPRRRPSAARFSAKLGMTARITRGRQMRVATAAAPSFARASPGLRRQARMAARAGAVSSNLFTHSRSVAHVGEGAQTAVGATVPLRFFATWMTKSAPPSA